VNRFLTAIMALVASVSGAAEVSVAWTFATQNIDGTPLTDLAGAKVYWGTASSNYTHVADVPGGQPGGPGSYTISNLTAGVTYYVNGTAYNTEGLESDFCAEVVRVAVDRPKPTWPKPHQKHEYVPPMRVVPRAVKSDGKWRIVLITEIWNGTAWEVIP